MYESTGNGVTKKTLCISLIISFGLLLYGRKDGRKTAEADSSLINMVTP